MHSAELDLDQYSELRAPIDGRIGDRRVSVGNLITGGAGGNTTLFATIVSVDPIRFEFTFDEASYVRYERFAKNRQTDQQIRSASRMHHRLDKPINEPISNPARKPVDSPIRRPPTSAKTASTPALRSRSS